MDTTLLNRITINPDICNGKPIVRNLRVTVETILQYLSAGDTTEEILNAYPFLEKEDVRACIYFALKALSTNKNEFQLVS